MVTSLVTYENKKNNKTKTYYKVTNFSDTGINANSIHMYRDYDDKKKKFPVYKQTGTVPESTFFSQVDEQLNFNEDPARQAVETYRLLIAPNQTD
jgi:hypothetical protein